MPLFAILLALLAAEALDALARPRRNIRSRPRRNYGSWPRRNNEPRPRQTCDAQPRQAAGRALHSLPLRLLAPLAVLGLGLVLTGNIRIASLLTVAAAAAFCVGSNLKFRMLGEPLVFSDLAVVPAIFRFPALYVFAIPVPVRIAVGLGLAAVLAGFYRGFVPYWGPHLAGLALCIAAIGALFAAAEANFMRHPDLEADVARHGVPLTLFMYWRRWAARRTHPIAAHAQTPSATADLIPSATADLIIVVQCESFADPADFAPPSPALPGLACARAAAWAWGNLAVTGFGAYTMRAEYGVLFGIEESALGFRRYDPFLTAIHQANAALPAKFPAYRSSFLHPYDLRFFGRDQLLPALGFSELVGATAFTPPLAATGPYVTDLAVAELLEHHIAASTAPSLFYVVTMENHGPWPAARIPGQAGGMQTYLHHLAQSDAMLERLILTLITSKRSAVLAFFGDHRPSIPGAVDDATQRHTPYVLLRIENGEFLSGPGRSDLTPAGLHHQILACASAQPAARTRKMQAVANN